MRLHFVSVPVYDSAQAEAELNQFLATHRVIAMDRQLIPDGPRSTWAVCVSYVTQPSGEAPFPSPVLGSSSKRPSDPRRVDYPSEVRTNLPTSPCIHRQPRFKDGRDSERVSVGTPMPKRSAVSLPDIASIDTLSLAFHQAARGKHQRPEVQAFAAHLDRELAALSRDILEGRSPDGNWTSFQIYDPKPRQILAPCFRDRVLHHALMLHVAPVLETALVDDTFACRPGKGTLAAVLRAQQHIRRFPWFVKTDVRAYFASIDHSVLMRLLRRRLKHPGVLALCERIVQRTPCGSEKGLPIGALTSQHFANTYLDGLDRFLLEQQRVSGLARYMDDIVWWVDGRRRAVETLNAAREYLATERHLAIKPTAQIGRSEQGLPFLGFRVLPGSLRLSLRRKRRYRAARLRWEQEYADGKID